MQPRDAIETAILICGTQRELANRLGVSAPTISYWIKKGVPKKHVPALVNICNNKVKHSDFRPDINWTYFTENAAGMI